MDKAIIVSIFKEIALSNVKAGIKMFDRFGFKPFDLVDNMSSLTNDDVKKYKIFGESGVRKLQKNFKNEFLD
tara:strand:+ start:248 stop:463 length:216 start_codon:yes stop_codon:yes gene_type:complete